MIEIHLCLSIFIILMSTCSLLQLEQVCPTTPIIKPLRSCYSSREKDYLMLPEIKKNSG